MPFNLSGKVAVVTGGASGIGQAIAEMFAQQGAIVCILDLNPEASQKTEQHIKANGHQANAFACNVTDQKNAISVIDTIVAQFGKIDILVNSAGISHIGKLENTQEADFEKVFQVNIKGVYNMMFAAVPVMVKQNAGVILNVASVAASVGLADRFAYSMSKGAVLTMTLSVAKDYIQHGIRCNSISPARVHTPFVDGFLKTNYPGKEEEMFAKLSKTQPIGRMAKPQEIAHLALYLCSDEASFITGSDYPIDGGFIKLNN